MVREGAIAAVLTGLMILLFLGSWRSTIIIMIEIPLAILFSLTALSLLGETINVMTLGGLALAVGILVDDGTVTLENINWHLEQGKALEPAILDGAQQIVIPAFVTLLVHLHRVRADVPAWRRGRLSVPADGGSRRVRAHRVVPAVAHAGPDAWRNYLLRVPPWRTATGRCAAAAIAKSAEAFPASDFEHRFEQIRDGYRRLLSGALGRPKLFDRRISGVVPSSSFGLVPFLGQNFFPSVDAGQILIHVRAQAGTRIEETARLCDEVEQTIRQTIPPDQLASVVDNIGLPISGINIAYQNTGTIGPEDGDILICSKKNHSPTAAYVKQLRTLLPQTFPGATFAFLPADIVSQILNFGLPAPIDLQVIGNEAGGQLRLCDRSAQAHSQSARDRRPAHPAGLQLSANQCRGRSDRSRTRSA